MIDKHLRKVAFILSLICSTLTFAQNQESTTQYEKEYYDLLNYIPKGLQNDSIHDLDSPYLKGGLNSIGSLKPYFGFGEYFNLSDDDLKWLESRIDQIATELFADGKRVILKAVGGYSGCPDKKIETFIIKNIEVTSLQFCHSCMDSYRDKKFIKRFNRKMYFLMKIDPPNGKTNQFYGTFYGYGRNNKGIELILFKDRTFRFWKRKGHSSDFTEGYWKNNSDTLILNSKILTKNDSLTFSLSSAKWIEFEDLEFRLKKEKLIELDNGYRKLKKDI